MLSECNIDILFAHCKCTCTPKNDGESNKAALVLRNTLEYPFFIFYFLEMLNIYKLSFSNTQKENIYFIKVATNK